jgi:hypothetical protein
MVQERLGLRALAGALHDLAAGGEHWELICAAHVLEHLEDLRGAMNALQASVADGGWLFVEVPDVSGFCAPLGAPFWQFSTEHINYFSPASLVNFLRQAGFEPVHLEQTRHRVHQQAEALVVRCLARRTQARDVALAPDVVTAAALREYVARSQQADAALLGRIAEITATGEPIIVWGAGAHTLRLLEVSDLARANLVAFVDSNPHYQGRTLCEVEVLPPEALQSRPEPILISSWVYQDEIAYQIREEMGLPNELICLYGEPSS